MSALARSWQSWKKDTSKLSPPLSFLSTADAQMAPLMSKTRRAKSVLFEKAVCFSLLDLTPVAVPRSRNLISILFVCLLTEFPAT